MPSAIIHASVAKKINKVLKLDEELFILGNIAPDCWRNGKNFGSRALSHFLPDNAVDEDYHLFYNKYKNNLNDPFVIGYLVHLMTDFYWRHNVTVNDVRLPLVDDFNINNYERKNFVRAEHFTLGEVAKYYNLSEIVIPDYKFYVVEEIDLTGLADTVYYINNAYFNCEYHNYNVFDYDKIIKCIEDLSEFLLKELNKLVD